MTARRPTSRAIPSSQQGWRSRQGPPSARPNVSCLSLHDPLGRQSGLANDDRSQLGDRRPYAGQLRVGLIPWAGCQPMTRGVKSSVDGGPAKGDPVLLRPAAALRRPRVADATSPGDRPPRVSPLGSFARAVHGRRLPRHRRAGRRPPRDRRGGVHGPRALVAAERPVLLRRHPRDGGLSDFSLHPYP